MKKSISFIIVITMIVTMVGCSKSNNNDTGDNPIPTDTYSLAETEKPTEAPTENEAVIVSRTEKYSITSPDYRCLVSNAFNNGVAWAKLNKEDSFDRITALINTNGEILYIAEEDVATTPFINDLSAVYQISNNNQSCPGFVIVNSMGDEVYTCTDSNIYMCGQADDGLFLMVKHESGFDHDVWNICTLDTNLTFTETGIAVKEELTYYHEIYEVSGGIYYFSSTNGMTVNLNSKTFLKYVNIAIVGFNDEYVCCYPYLYIRSAFYFVPISSISEVNTENDLMEIIQNDSSVKCFDGSQKQNLYFKIWHNGSFLGTITTEDRKLIYKYWDIDGNVLLDFPEFANGVRYIELDNFSGEYAAILLEGVDKNYYITIIDEKGTTQYEPIQVSKDLRCSCNGYSFFYNNEEGLYDIIAPDGSHKKLGDDLSGLEDYRAISAENGYGFTLSIGGGYIFCHDGKYKYVSIDGRKTIETVEANYNSNGNLIFTNNKGEKNTHFDKSYTKEAPATEAATDSVASQKDYINTNNFPIIGKWKNVGEYTFGQAQKGSIIVFNGANCNFFSPNDTYAFYKNGKNYQLDCTSPLADTVSFTVKIIDENNIDVFNGSNIIELKRVD